MNSLSQNNTDSNDIADQKCLRHALSNYQKNPGSQIMMGPGLGQDTRHFWIVKIDGTVVDTTPGYDNYPFYSRGEVFDLNKNKDVLDKLSLPTEK